MASEENKRPRTRSMFDDLFELQPNRSLMDTMNDFFQNTMSKSIPVQVKESNDSYNLSVQLPGVAKEDIDLEMRGEYLHITVDRQQSITDTKAGYSSKKDMYLERRIRIPSDAMRQHMTARYDNGLLSISFPKVKGKKIDID
ncbi:Hsp20/alpha crystallin family protein [Thalassobacillus hwangdonensis]|uniref:Hsp20/alpha crystallin family protein n=1 Tax=Thalassobacillus hwangdonensis TaxID=546108 RepID=A0ABW3L178_9BACI